MSESEIAALLSGFVCQGKAKNNKFDPLEDFDHSNNNYNLVQKKAYLSFELLQKKLNNNTEDINKNLNLKQKRFSSDNN